MDSFIRVVWNFVCIPNFVTCAVCFAHIVLVNLSVRYHPVQSSVCETYESITETFFNLSLSLCSNGPQLKKLETSQARQSARREVYIPLNTFIITVMLTGGNFPFPVPINNILFVWVLRFV